MEIPGQISAEIDRQISENGLHEAVLGNCGTIVAFRLGAEDAEMIGRAIGAPATELISLTRGHAYARTLYEGQPTRAYPMQVKPAQLRSGHLSKAEANTKANFARARALIEQKKPRTLSWS